MKTTVGTAQNKRVAKKLTNIKWNSRLFFQIGVILSLLLVFFVMQINVEINRNTAELFIPTTMEEPAMIDYVLDVEKPRVIEPPKNLVKQVPFQKPVQSSVVEVAPNSVAIIETPIAAVDAPLVVAPVKPLVEEPILNEPRSVLNVEFVPVFPGCESLATNNEKIECMSSKINTFINKNFRKEYLENLQPNETHRIYVNFKIDANGFITDVIANSHNPNLKKEAQRVVNELPKMKPGKQGNKNVDVMYTVPIAFQIH